MDSTLKVRTIDSLYKDILRNRILLVHKLQRKEGQWSNKQKFDLIDSVFRNIPLNPTYMIEERGDIEFSTGSKTVMMNYVIDGVQRLSTIRDFISNKFRIGKSYNNMLGSFILDGEEIDIKGKKFSDLDDWVKEYFLSRELQLYILTNFTDSEVREMFKRQNAGSPLTNAQKNVVLLSDGLRECIDELSCHDFWKSCKLSSTDFKKDAIRNVILQCMWVIARDDFEITDFLAKENGGLYKDFVPYLEEESNYISIYEQLTECLDSLIIDSKIKLGKPISCFTKASIPAIIYGMHIVLKDGGIKDRYYNIIDGFILNYDSDLWNWYREELKDGIYQHKKVIDRIELFKNLALATKYVDIIEKRKLEYEERTKGVIETDSGYFIEETEEERKIREKYNTLEPEISDEELDRAAELYLNK